MNVVDSANIEYRRSQSGGVDKENNRDEVYTKQHTYPSNRLFRNIQNYSWRRVFYWKVAASALEQGFKQLI